MGKKKTSSFNASSNGGLRACQTPPTNVAGRPRGEGWGGAAYLTNESGREGRRIRVHDA